MSNNNTDQCQACLERHPPYPKKSFTWDFWNKNNGTAGSGQALKPEDCEPKTSGMEASKGPGSKAEASKAETSKAEASKPKPVYDSKQPGTPGCTPMPPSDVPLLSLPGWFDCPPTITVPPYAAPNGVDIRPISEGGRNGTEPLKISGKCPMARQKTSCITPDSNNKEQGGGAQGRGFMTKFKSFFGFGDKK